MNSYEIPYCTIELPETPPSRELGIYSIANTINTRPIDGTMVPMEQPALAIQVKPGIEPSLFGSLEGILESVGKLRGSLAERIKAVINNLNSSSEEYDIAAELMSSAPQQDITDLIIEMIKNQRSSPDHLKLAIELISSAPEQDRSDLIRMVLDTCPWQKDLATDQICSAPEQDRTDLIREVLGNPKSSYMQKVSATEQICSAPEQDRTDLICEVLFSTTTTPTTTQVKNCLRMISIIPEENRAILISEILKKLTSYESCINLAIIKIKWVPSSDRDILIKYIQNSPDFTKKQKYDASKMRNKHPNKPTQKETAVPAPALRIKPKLSKNTAQVPLKKIPESPSLTSPLHKQSKEGQVVPFTKGGSETFILPSDEEKSVRVIPFDAMLSWLDAYLAAKVWEEAGFHYIPVETVVAVHDEFIDGLNVAVVTNNLRGVSLAKSVGRYDESVQAQIFAAQDAIKVILNSLGIRHGHLHEGNFVLVPKVCKDKNGNVVADPSQMPRIYVIDFDMAESSP